ncbi:STAS/SEC14 domain-containing protein [Arthrobacter sp. Soil761]|uniref:DUF7793 family protein n=1 Tax=Arthrobacter sp. Soil761 TaxID=1736400 RepID=UPI0006FC95BA|nr:STAS/SEC14 domain-containing protein [Arthrobacter sp. Soil761]KRE76658.1 hypothetical protein ASG79_17675 [Arthrobacter sp. Soil761]
MRQGLHDDHLGAVDLYGRVLRVRWAPGILISEAAARAMLTRARELTNGQELPILVEMTGIKGLTPHAGSVFATEWPLGRTAIVGDSPVHEVIAVFYTARHKPATPTRFFSSVNEALTWLTEPAGNHACAAAQPGQDQKKAPRPRKPGPGR